MSTFNASDHARLATLFDGVRRKNEAGGLGPLAPYPGYRPEVREAPNGGTKACARCSGTRLNPTALSTELYRPCEACVDGRVPNVDITKRYLHVAPKYNPPAWAVEYLARAHYEACRVAEALGVPAAYYPRVADGTLRVLEYPSAACEYEGVITGNGHWRCVTCGHEQMASPGGPSDRVCPALAPGAGTAEHTDFDLFTIVLWRSHPVDLERGRAARGRMMGHSLAGFGGGPNDIPSCVHCGEVAPEPDSTCWDAYEKHDVKHAIGGGRAEAEAISPGLHIGEIGELVGLGPATPHRVPARPYAQKSIVYFAMPDHAAQLPGTGAGGFPPQYVGANGPTVGEWLRERIARSRY